MIARRSRTAGILALSWSEPLITSVLLLAGGAGTRIRHLHPDVPKPLIPIQGCPFLAWILRYWRRHGISTFIVSLGHLAEKAEAYLSAAETGVTTVREAQLLGTGGAIVFKQNVISSCVCLPGVVSWSHEATPDIGSYFRTWFAAGDPTFRRVTLRSSAAWRIAGSAGHDLPGSGAVARGRPTFGGVLGSPLPAARLGGPDGGRTVRTAQPAE